jgi:hypothetical protein
MEGCGNRASCGNLFKKLQILPLTSQYVIFINVCGSEQKSLPNKQQKSQFRH